MKFSIALFLCLSNLIFCQAQHKDRTLAEVELKNGTIIRGGFERLSFDVLNRPLQIDIVNVEKVLIKSADSDSTEEDFILTAHIINFSEINTVKILQNEVIQIPSIVLKSKVKFWPQISSSQPSRATEETPTQSRSLTKETQFQTTDTPPPPPASLPSRETMSQPDKIERGPRGGCYYVSKTGKKTYVNKSRCN